MQLKVRAVIEQHEDSYFGYCPDLSGILVQGDTADEARQFLQESLSVHLGLMISNNEPLPSTLILEQDTPTLVVSQNRKDFESPPILEITTKNLVEDLVMSFA